MLQIVLKRVAPGDRWAEFKDEKISEYSEEDVIADNLSDGLLFVYKKYDCKEFIVNANTGLVSIDVDGGKLGIIKPKVFKEHDLYK